VIQRLLKEIYFRIYLSIHILVQLLESDPFSIFSETLSAEHQTILPDDTMAIGAGATVSGAWTIIFRPGVVDAGVGHD